MQTRNQAFSLNARSQRMTSTEHWTTQVSNSVDQTSLYPPKSVTHHRDVAKHAIMRQSFFHLRPFRCHCHFTIVYGHAESTLLAYSSIHGIWLDHTRSSFGLILWVSRTDQALGAGCWKPRSRIEILICSRYYCQSPRLWCISSCSLGWKQNVLLASISCGSMHWSWKK